MALPIELIEKVFNEVDDVNDMVCLCISSKDLLRIGQKTCISRIAETEGRWVGARLICIRDIGQWPKARRILDPPTRSTGSNREDAIDLAPLYKKIVAPDISLLDIENDNSSCATGGRYGAYLQQKRPQPELRKWLLSKLELELFRRFENETEEPSSPWVLCNLTKRHYVVYDDIRNMAWDELAQVLITQICWAPGGQSGGWKTAPQQGRWVGDRFEITTLDRLRRGVKPWVDISEELLGELEAIRNLD